ncbi:putative glutathione S-transferase [Wickerhamomyces ciferrii]|uniref:Glutathione S-transferase n=1 Tax=Wickerhamomyces ciferrii (strain ATCC 14091 / BCRC 22168 / CBS 111 / JCM 3599 / NBRC 0793 / NRRL Y-1031 F-60-10) TaxID=1206466 RepID=K0KJF1_WICCF|nr:putative glutathione S-transferase [Wickerhamomyces ciferrii]CCH41228.1 putative glutathione S-transferase [Wickerhamomyces ciferrii]
MVKVDEGDAQLGALEAPYTKLYSVGTSNGQKITIFLELLKKDYIYRKIDFSIDEQKQPWFIELNPNGRIPVLSDVDKDGKRITLHETGVILQYLADKYDTERKYSYDHNDPLWWEQFQWLVFQVASHSPLQGQAHHFVSFAKVDNEYGKKRYTDEAKRIYGVYEIRLKQNNGWLVGDKLNIADISAYPWISRSRLFKTDLSEWPNLQKWVEKIAAIPEVAKGQSVN